MKLTIKFLILFLVSTIQAQTDSILQSGNYLKAVEWLNTQEESAQKYKDLGKIYYEIGSFNKAINCYSKSLKISPEIRVKKHLAKAYKSNGNYKKAIFQYKEIVESDSLNYLTWYQLGTLHKRVENHREALNIFEKLHKIDPSNSNYLYQKALLSTNLYERANLFLEVFTLDSLHTKSMFHLANFFKTIRDKDSARLFMNKALEINPNDTKILPLKINDLYRQKKYNLALDLSLKLDSLVVNDVFANQRIGLCYWKLNDYDKAKKYLKKATKIDRDDKVSYYYLGLLYKDLKEYKKAKYSFLQAIYLEKPDTDNEFYHLGLIAQEEKKPREAIKNFKEAFENNHRNFKALFELAVMSDLYYKDKSIALKHYRNYLELFQNLQKENTAYIQRRVKEIEEAMFMKGQ